MAKVSINSNEISSIITSLNTSCNSIENEISSKVKSSFQVLADLGLVSNIITKIEKQAKSIVDVEKSIISTVSKHLGDVSDNEKSLKVEFNSGYSSNGTFSEGEISSYVGDTSESESGSEIEVDQKDDGKKINVEGFSQLVNLLTDDDKKSLLEIIKTKKDEDTELVDLFLDTKNSEELFTIIKDIFSTVEFEKLTIDEIKEVQKILLNTIINSDTEYVDLENNSILIAKEYLKDISKNYEISVGDLILDDRYSNVLKESLIKLYNGTVSETVSVTEIDGFREYVNLVSIKKGITSEELLNDRVEDLL